MPEPLRVVHVISDAGPHPWFDVLVRHTDPDRVRLTVGGVGSAGPLQETMAAMGVETFALGADRRAEWPLATIRLARLLRTQRAQVLQGHLVTGCLVGQTAARIARTPVSVMTAHHSHELPFHGRKLRWVDRVLGGPLSDVIAAPSSQVAEVLIRHAHTARSKLAIIPHGFELEHLARASDHRAGVRAELGLGEDATLLATVGRIFWLKNQAALIRSFASVASEDPDLHLLVIGPGDTSDLAALARATGVTQRVTFTGARSDVPAILAQADAFVHPATAESFGMVILEAMAVGLPVLSTPVGIAPDVLADGAIGEMAAGTDVEALSAALRRLLERRSQWPEMGRAAQKRAQAFDVSTMVAAYDALYRTRVRDTG
jgi:glycosyltransferase involved in cell wall biosynthesis